MYPAVLLPNGCQLTCSELEADSATASDKTDAPAVLVPSFASSAPGVGETPRHWPAISSAANPLLH
jgi:hypothetical protein